MPFSKNNIDLWATRGFVALALAAMLHLAPADATAAEQVAQREVQFNRDIRPILSDNCFQCHGPDERQRKARLRLDDGDLATAPRASQVELPERPPAIVPGDAAASELVRRITHADRNHRMPPPESERELTPEEIAILKRWIDSGAEYEPHWAFIPPQRPSVPATRMERWARNPIDRFVLARLEQDGYSPSRQADHATLIRRLSLDLTGLPPTVEQVDSFLLDNRPDAYERLVDRLLASPRYGEHMAASWLDAARYADTNGYNNDTPRYNWRYRDWVIWAFNRNLPYDQFLTQQIAGDLLPEPTLDQKIATGFCRNHNITSEGGIIDEEYRIEYVADRVHTTATVFMALSMQCARCHDHKFDPISQREYYEFFAFFNQIPEQGYHAEHVGNVKPVIEAPTARQRDRERQLVSRLRKLREVQSQASAKGAPPAPPDEEESALLEELRELRESFPTAMVMRELESPRTTHVLERGMYDRPAEEVSPDVPDVLGAWPEGAPRDRLGLARWLTRPDHPLTSRVAVNRIWAQFFGHGLVDTPEDFGSQGAWPTHPELLDWLAVELVDSGWDVQHIQKLIVTSATYRQSSRIRPEDLEADPENRLYARGPRFRMSAEMIRDSALAASGLLVNKLGGPSVKPYQPPGLWEEVAVGDVNYAGPPYKQDTGDDLYRRSLYIWWKRTCPPPNLATFDAPNREFCVVERSRTNTPLQALVLMNDPTFVEAARALAERAMQQTDSSEAARARRIFRRVLARAPAANELDLLVATYREQLDRFERPSDERAVQLTSVGDSAVAPHVDRPELAAWTVVASLVFNLDEAVTKE